MKFRPLNTIAILLAAFGAIEAGRLGLKASQAIAEGSGHEQAAEEAPKTEEGGEGDAEHAVSNNNTCVPVDLAKEKGISAAEFNLLTNLQDRRIELDSRENDILTREGILKTAEAIVQAKIDNLHQVEANIQKLLVQVDEMEAQRISGLVRVYEKMKPKDAALVMQGLSDETVIAIASKMKDQSLALILAKMDTVRARQITSMLAQIDDNQIQSAMNPPPAPAAAPQKVANNASGNNKLPPVQNPPSGVPTPNAPNAPKVSTPQAPGAPQNGANQPAANQGAPASAPAKTGKEK